MSYNNQNNIKYFLFSVSNFLAAIGGGTILGKGVGIIDNKLLQESSILAFFMGTVLGLVFLQAVPKKWSALIARSFSFFGAFASLGLLYIFEQYAIDGKILGNIGFIFFGLLSVRFGFWFYSRVLRAGAAAGHQQKIAWVELGYYLGIMVGLVAWKFVGLDFGIAIALILDSCLQLSAGFIDLLANSHFIFSKDKLITPGQRKIDSVDSFNPNKAINKYWCWRLAGAVIFITIGTQVIIFYSAHKTTDWFAPYILAFYYLGVSIAAIVYKTFKMKLEWVSVSGNTLGRAMISSELAKSKKRISVSVTGLLATLTAGIVALASIHFAWNTTIKMSEIILLFFVIASAFFYEIFALAVLDRIGIEEVGLNNGKMITRTYGLMGVGAAVGLWILGVTQSADVGLIFTLIVCLFFSVFVIRKRNLSAE